MATSPSTALPPIVSQDAWRAALAAHVNKEKALMKARDRLNAARRRLPVVEITTPYTFEGPDGDASLLDLFDGQRQLIVQHFMFHPDWEEGCVGCSMMADHLGPLAHLRARNTRYVAISRAPLEKLLAYKQRMGWTDLPWYSSFGTDFNADFGVTVDDQEDSGLSFLLRDGDRIFWQSQVRNRGVEDMISTFWLLDQTPLGRQEKWEDSPDGWPQTPPYAWWRRHDEYGGEDRR